MNRGAPAAGRGTPVRLRTVRRAATLAAVAFILGAVARAAHAQPGAAPRAPAVPTPVPGTPAAPPSSAAPPSCDRASAAPTDRRIPGDALDVAWRASPAPAVGRPFAIEFVLCPRGAASGPIDRVKVDAWMPAHRHGMNYAPTVSGTPGGPMRAEGLLFHMPGAWQVVFELRHDGRALRLVDDVAVR